MKKLLCVLAVLIVTAGFVFAGGGKASDTQSGAQSATIAVGGSTSVQPLMDLFKAAYEAANSNITITVSGTGSGDGITSTAAGTYDIGMSSRELRPAEKADVTELTIAIDGIAVIVNTASPVSNLTTDQLKSIYTGEITNWNQLGAAANGKTGAIAVVSRESGSGTRGAFEEIIGFQNLVAGANELNSTGAVTAAVAGNPDSIGYISLGSVNTTIKALNIGGVQPTNANVVNKSYTIARPFILMTKAGAQPSAATQAFLTWAQGSDGQAIVARSWIRVDGK